MSAIDMLVVRTSEGREEAAFLSGTRLIEVRVAQPQAVDEVGSIHLGRVEQLAGDVEAAFVDFGAARAGFLRFSDMIGEEKQRPQAGDPILVQVLRQGDGEKGARLSMKMALPGRHLRLRPQETGLSFDARIEDPVERERITQALAEPGADCGITVRANAIGRGGEALQQEVGRLLTIWDRVRSQALTAPPPKLLHRDAELMAAAVRDCGATLKRIVVDDRQAAMRATQAAAEQGDAIAVEFHRGEPPIFDIADIDAQIEQALADRVMLPSGGELLFEGGRALTAIDVDSGSLTGMGGANPRRMLVLNLEAAEEIARQLRLRNIGGIVIVDFAAMRDGADRDRVLGRLALALAEDPISAQLVGPTRLGLVELTRARRGRTLAASFDLGNVAAVERAS